MSKSLLKAMCVHRENAHNSCMQTHIYSFTYACIQAIHCPTFLKINQSSCLYVLFLCLVLIFASQLIIYSLYNHALDLPDPLVSSFLNRAVYSVLLDKFSQCAAFFA